MRKLKIPKKLGFLELFFGSSLASQGTGWVNCSNGGVFVDSRSNIGKWILYIGGMAGVQALAFEPVESQRQCLSSCLQYQPGWNFTVYPLALGSENCNWRFNVMEHVRLSGAIGTRQKL